MKKLSVILMALIVACTPYVATKNSKTSSEQQTEQVYVPPQTPKAYTGTFLDTINNGNEICLDQTVVEYRKSVTQNDNSSIAEPPRYRIQLFASSQIESLREKKREIESSISLPLVIVFETPYYKLLAGDFSQRSEAESAISKLKKMGYTDAWIVTLKSAIISN